MRVRDTSIWLWLTSGKQRRAAAVAVAVLLAVLVGVAHFSAKAASSEKDGPVPGSGAPARGPTDVVELSDAQLGEISIGTVSEHTFPIQTEAVGNIDFN